MFCSLDAVVAGYCLLLAVCVWFAVVRCCVSVCVVDVCALLFAVCCLVFVVVCWCYRCCCLLFGFVGCLLFDV